jgi:hypothetical protein
MTGVPSYSTTASENVNSNTGINWDEGMPPASVNNSARQNMADMRTQWNDAAWFLYGNGSKTVAHTYASSTSTTIATDQTTYYHAGRRIKAVGSGTGTIYGKVASSSYSAPNTTVNYTWDSGSLSNEALTVYASVTPVTGKPLSLDCNGDYAEGTFTPAINFGGASVGVTYSSQAGSYTKIGNRVFFNLVVVLTSKGSSTGTLAITGLPFTASNADVAAAIEPGSFAAGINPTANVTKNSTGLALFDYAVATGVQTQISNTGLTNTTNFAISGHYSV